MLVLLSGFTLAIVLYYNNQHEPFSKMLTRLLFLFRFITGAGIAYLLLNPYFLQTKKQIEPPILILAHDNSASITNNADSTFYRKSYPTIIDSLITSLANNYTIEYFQFGQHIVKNHSLSFTDQQTDIGEVFSMIKNNYFNRNIGAILLFTDGIYNKGENPYPISKTINIPVLAIALGDTVSHPDLSLFDLRYNKTAYLKSQFTVETTLRATQLRGKTAILELFNESKKIEERTIFISANKFSSTQYFVIEADKIGYKKLTIKVKTDANESTLTNNERSFFVEVVANKHHVLIWAKAPHPDIAAIRSSLGENFETVVQFGNDDLSQNNQFDLLIFHQLPASTIDFQLLKHFLDANKTIPVLIIVGTRTDIGSLNKLQQAMTLKTMQGKGVESMPLINKTFGLFATNFSDYEVLSSFPPLLSPSAEFVRNFPDQTLFFQQISGIETVQPMISFTTVENRKLGFIFGTGIWRWKLAKQGSSSPQKLFDHIMDKSISYLLMKEDKYPLQIMINEQFSSSDEIIFKALLRNKTAELLNTAELKLEIITDEDKAVFPFVFAQSGQGYELNAGQLATGTYTYLAHTELGGEKLEAKGKFKIENTTIERIDPVANHRLLYQIAQETGGRVISKDSLQLISTWLKNQPNITSIAHYTESYLPIVNYYWAFVILTALLFCEWLLRKIYGSY